MLEHFIAGFTINLFTSADDAITDIPVLSSATKTRKGRLVYALGKIIAVTLAIAIAFVLSRFIATLPHPHIIVASLVFVMAFVIYFDIFSIATPKKITKKVEVVAMTTQRFFKLMTLGFLMTFTTMLDDMFTLSPLFIDSMRESIAAIAGIYAASFVLIIAVMYFAKQIQAVPHKREIATAILIAFGFLLLFGVV
jgi:hypothetical protein